MKSTKIDYGSKKFSMYFSEEVVASTLGIFGEGMKVASEITLMAADAGVVRTERM